MPVVPNTLRVHTEYVLIKSVGPKVLWAESRVQGNGENLPPFQFHVLNVEGEIHGSAIYRLFGNFTALNHAVTCMGLKAKANNRRTSSPLSMNFMGLDLPMSDRWHEQQQQHKTF
ncbi:hypothetical protein TNCV_1066851 [Trichonephila clavipes]|uniref:Uncharacterized protein n=1 Tax=Trichonephila clavipes TaxID=2585209 RepID=A0A8X6RA23_TRICX|nr:hypothetical protein TNCV_1066851 [Trichonephila clavipes]